MLWSDGKLMMNYLENQSGTFLVDPNSDKVCFLYSPDSMSFTISASQEPRTGRIALLRTNLKSSRVEVSVFDPAGLCDGLTELDTVHAHVLHGGPQQLTSLTWSADGKALYALEDRGDGTADLKRLPVTIGVTSQPQLTTSMPGLQVAPPADVGTRIRTTSVTFSKGGATAVYVRGRSVITLEAVTVTSNGSVTTTPVIAGTSANSFPLFSPDGSSIAYLAKQGAQLDLRIHNLTTGDGRRLPVRDTITPGGMAWSPDGNRLAFHVLQRGEEKIAIATLDPPIQIRVLSGSQPSSWGDLAWAPGSTILYQSHEQGYGSIDPATGSEVPLFGAGSIGYPFAMVVAPGGKVAAYLMILNEPGVYLIDLTTRQSTLLHDGRLWPIQWSVSGDEVFAFDEALNSIVAVRLSGGSRVVGHLPFPATFTSGFTSDGKGRFIFPRERVEGDVWAIENLDAKYREAGRP